MQVILEPKENVSTESVFQPEVFVFLCRINGYSAPNCLQQVDLNCHI